MMLRSGLTYSQASNNAKRIGAKAYDEAIAAGKSKEVAQEIYFNLYNKEMEYYES